jgi:hypothetical protein
MDSTILSSPTGENFDVTVDSDRFYRLTEAEVIHFRECKYSLSVVTVYCYIKTLDPFGNGLQIIPKQAAKKLNYHHRTVSRAIKALVKAGEIGLAIVEAHVKIVAQSVESVTEIVSKLGLGNTPTPDPIEPPISMPVVETVIAPISTPPTAPKPQPSQFPTGDAARTTRTTSNSKSGCSSVGSVIANMGFGEPSSPFPFPPKSPIDLDSTSKTPQWYDRIERRLNALDIQLKDVGHALKKYPVRAIEDGIAYTQKQTWSKAKAGVFVNYLKKWTPMTSTVQSPTKSTSQPQPVITALMQRFPDTAGTLAKEQNPIDEATLDYLERLRVDGLIYNTHYNTIDNYFGVFITQQDYPHPIPWWDALTRLQQLYPICA